MERSRERVVRSTLLASMATLALASSALAEAGPITPIPPDALAPLVAPTPDQQTATEQPTVPQPTEALTGLEYTSEDGLYVGLGDINDSLTLVHKEDKTAFVGVRRVGESVISMCVYVNRWQLRKYHKDVLPKSPDNPCTAKQMNALKHPSKFTRHLIKGRVDGNTSTEVVKWHRGCNPILYRNYRPRARSPVYVPSATKPGFSMPLKIDGKPARLSQSVHFRYIPRDDGNIAAVVRVNRSAFKGKLTPEQRIKLNAWFIVDRSCLEDDIKQTGPRKRKGMDRGHSPLKKLKHLDSSKVSRHK